MDITKRLIMLDPSLEPHNEGNWGEPLDPNKRGFTSFNDAGIECETGEFLYSMVRLLKPDRVLETGTHFGVGTSYMGLALKDNKHGMIDTIEFLPEIYRTANARFSKVGLTGIVNNLQMDVRNFKTPSTYKLILLDTEPQTRFDELIQFYDNLEEGGFVFIHDLHQHMHQIENEEHGFAWPFGRLPLELERFVNTGKLRPFHFETPRGLTGFYKVHSKDYEW